MNQLMCVDQYKTFSDFSYDTVFVITKAGMKGMVIDRWDSSNTPKEMLKGSTTQGC